MKTYLYNFAVEPIKNDWFSTWRNENVRIEAESLKAANEKFFVVLEEKYFFEISKTARKNPSKMYCDFKDGSTKQTGFVFKASTEIDFDRKWKKRFANIWASIEVLMNPFEA